MLGMELRSNKAGQGPARAKGLTDWTGGIYHEVGSSGWGLYFRRLVPDRGLVRVG